MKLETWVYKQALELYPRAYREQFGQAMLETYSDSLRAAKLEREVFEFHKATTIDTIKGIFQATIETQCPNLLARAAAIFAFVYGIFFILAMFSFKFLESMPANLLRTGSELGLYILGFILATRREFSEWLYFAIMSVGTAVRAAMVLYFTTIDWNPAYVPANAKVMGQVYEGLGWALFAGFFVVVFFRSKEQKRLSRLVWYGIFSSLLWTAFYVIPVRQFSYEGFRIESILAPLNNLSGLAVCLYFVLKFWQRSQPDFRLVETRS